MTDYSFRQTKKYKDHMSKAVKLAKSKSPNFVCEYCGKAIYYPPHRLKRGNCRFCSIECKGKALSERQRGPNNHRYGKKSPINSQVETTCHTCGKKYFVKKSWVNKSKYCSRKCRTLWVLNNVIKNQYTTIELIIGEELQRHGIIYETQIPIETMTIADIYIRQHKIVICCDGDYWHNPLKIKRKDVEFTLRLARLGYAVFRYSENNINVDSKKCVDQIIEYISGHPIIEKTHQVSLIDFS